MPSPDTRRDSFIKYLRHGYSHHEPWIDGWGTHTAEEVKECIKGLSETDEILYTVLRLYTISRMPRHLISARINYDYSTVKRKLDQAIECILFRLANKDIDVKARREEKEAKKNNGRNASRKA
jgi:hypothetical protein